jgi:PAS domain S-box-containing protein
MTAPPAGPAGRRPPARSDDARLAAGVDDLLRSATEEAARLLGADGAMLYLLDPATERLRFTHDAGIDSLGQDHWLRTLELAQGVGLFGRAVAERRVVVTDDYIADTSFVHAGPTDRFVHEVGLRSMVVAPMVAGDEVFGALGVFAASVSAFTAPQIALVRALADHAALAMANARLIDELARSREALARQAVVERSLRELGTRISGAHDPGAVVQQTIDEALRLLGGTGARIDIVDPEVNQLRGLYSSGDEEILATEWPRDLDDRLEVGVSGRAVVTGATYISPDYLADELIVHSAGPDTYARAKGIRGVIATPLVGGHGPFGAITVWSSEPDAFGLEDAAILETIAGQSAVALGRARLIEELGQSREALARRADEERTLREIGARLGTVGEDPGDVLLRIVHEAARLLEGERARLDLLEPLSGSWLWTYPAGTPFNDRIIAEELAGTGPGGLPIGLAGLAVAEGRPVASGDYVRDERFHHYPEGDAGVRDVGLHSIVAAPIIGEDGLLGVLQAGHRQPDAFGEDALRLIGALASQASIAITNARLVDRLASSQLALERSANTERSLREIAARITSVRDADTILAMIVDEARRVLGSDGAHLTRMSEDRTCVRPVVVAGGMDEETRAWLRTQAFPIHGGINGLAAGLNEVVWTADYAADDRIPHDADDDGVAARMDLGAMAAAPLRAPGGEVIGTLTVSYHEPRPIGHDQLVTLQALADHAAIALSNSDLLGRLEASEERYRGLVQSSPDLIFEMDGAGIYTFYSDRTEEAIGWSPGEMIGRPFTEFIDMTSFPQAAQRIAEIAASPGVPFTDRLLIRHKANGRLIPFEVSVVGQVDETGRLQAIRGVARNVSERERLETRLRASEERYRFLVENAPDVVFSTDAFTRFTFISDTVERLTGFRPDELVGEPFDRLITPETLHVAVDRWDAVAADPSLHSVLRLDLRHRDGGRVPVEIHSVGQADGRGLFAGVLGSARDIGDRERLERELRESEERYRSVIQSSPDLIWATNSSGRYVFVSDRVRDLLGWEPDEVLGRPFREFIDEQSVQMTDDEWARLAREPGRTQTHRIDLRHRDGTLHPFEVSSVAVVRDGEVENVYGIARDITERERLERELRDSEERYRYLVQSSPDLVWMTDEAGRFTFISDQARAILGWDPPELIGRSFADLAPAQDRRASRARFRFLQRRPTEAHRTHLRVRSRDGRDLAMEVTGIGMVADGHLIGAHGAARDVSERERLEQGLRRQAAELASSEERAHLARELHDSVTQALFSMTLLSRTIELLLDRDPSQVPGKLASLRELQREALAEMRALIFELRPGNVEEHGLIGALRTHSASLSGRIGLPVVVEADLPTRPAIEVEETLYRIAQEALHNVVKHAGARSVRVQVAVVGDEVRLTVTDDGRGFDPGAVPDGHLGLAGMRSRAERLGGTLVMTASPGRGTTVDAAVPFAPRVADGEDSTGA